MIFGQASGLPETETAPVNGQGAIQRHTGGRATAEEGAIPWSTTTWNAVKRRETTTHLFVVYELLNVFDT